MNETEVNGQTKSEAGAGPGGFAWGPVLGLGLAGLWIAVSLLGGWSFLSRSRTVTSNTKWVAGSRFVPVGMLILAGDVELVLTQEKVSPHGPDVVPYVVLKAPQSLESGTSEGCTVSLALTNGTAASDRLRFTTNELYTAKVKLVAESTVLGVTPREDAEQVQTVSWGRPASWSWLVAPKEKSLRKQTLFVNVFMRKALDTNEWQNIHVANGRIEITGPFGFGGFFHYVVVPILGLFRGGVVQAAVKRFVPEKAKPATAQTPPAAAPAQSQSSTLPPENPS